MYSSAVIHQERLPSTASPTRRWLHHHPIAQKILILAIMTLSIYNILEGAKHLSFSKATMGVIYLGVAYLTMAVAFPILAPPTHSPKNHSFCTGTYQSVSLSYYHDLPILEIPKNVSAFDAGYAQGYLMADPITNMRSANKLLRFLKGYPSRISHLAKKIQETLPSEYIDEIKGVVAGYNARQVTSLNSLSVEEIIYFHLLPEGGHLDFKEQDSFIRRNEPVMGCTTVVDGNIKNGPKAIRTLDWLPMDVYGKYAYVVFRETASGMRTVNQSFPGFIGYLTFMNEKGLSGALNVARGLTDYPEGLPSTFFLRKLAESCSTIGDLDVFIQNNPPLGPFNLTILDPKTARSVHFFQSEKERDTVRSWTPGMELITLNFRYGDHGVTNATTSNSEERQQEIESHYKGLREKNLYNKQSPKTRLIPLLHGEEVNNIRTTSVTYLSPRERGMWTAVDNGYAADHPLQKIPSENWLLRKDRG